jgi:hypothetical protein
VADPKKFNVSLTLREVNLIATALTRLGEADPAAADPAKALRLKIDRRVESKVNRSSVSQKKPKEKFSEYPPSSDALSRRLPGSFESAQR